MANSIYVREKQDKRWRYRRIPEGRGIRTSNIQGPFFARPTLNGKQIWQRLDAATFVEAKEELDQLAVALEARSRGLTVAELDDVQNANRIPLRRAVDTYLEQKRGKARRTRLKYKQTLDRFVELAGVRFLDEVNVDVLRAYKRKLEDAGYAPITVYDHLNVLTFLLKKNNIPDRIPKDEMPVIEEEPAMPYTNEELDRLFTAMNAEEVIRYKFFLGSGCREKEVTYASWSDLNFERGTYTVRSKPDMAFTIKNHEQRTVPLPKSLVEDLQVRKQNAPHSRWIFVNRDGRPDNHFLRKVKRIAFKAKMNCGQCMRAAPNGGYKQTNRIPVSCANSPVCRNFTLHRFRKTCATRWMDAGIPIRTIQHWLGHKELETTQRYLGVGNIEELRGKIDAAFGD